MLLLHRHKKRVCALAYSQDGHTLASGGEDKIVRVWDPATGQERTSLKGHKACIYSVAFSRDNLTLASSGGQKQLILWDLTGKREPVHAPGHTLLVGAVAFSPNGKLLASADGMTFLSGGLGGGGVFLWDVKPFQKRGSKNLPGGVQSLAFAPNGKELALGTVQRVMLCDLSFRGKSLEQGAAVRDVVYSPDGQTLAVAAGWNVNIWNVKTMESRHTLKGHKSFVWSVAFAPDGRTLLSGSEDKTVKFWDVASGSERGTFDWKVGKIRAVAFAPDGMTAAAGGDGPIVVWDVD
jgi:WD40 repeat protein